MRDPLQVLGIPRSECGREVTAQHLQAFVDAFVVASSRVRLHNLLRRRRWRGEVPTLVEERLDPALCRLDVAQSRPVRWDPRFRGVGIHIADAKVGLSMRLEQASALSIQTCTDAIFSLDPGRLAVWLNHEWGVRYCARP
jgi:hypothetical protein